MAPVRILFGGSFDPPTLAHRRLIEIALAAFPGAEMVVIPAGSPPHKQARVLTAAALRLEMARIAFEDLPDVRVSDEECQRPGLSFTVDTLTRHRRQQGDAPLYWLIGSDSLLELPTWKEPDRILELAQVVTVPRPGFDANALAHVEVLTTAQRETLRDGILAEAGPPLSSTEARTRLQRGVDASHLVDAQVLSFIRHHGLYASVGGD